MYYNTTFNYPFKDGFMETAVIMKRQLLGYDISQNSKTEMFSATDLARAGNVWRASQGMSIFDMKAWFNQVGTKDFIEELERRYGTVKISGRGRGNHTWVHPLLFIDMALAISPTLKVETYQWLLDNLIKFRNDSGDSYRLMSAALFTRHTNHKNFPELITKVAEKIKKVCGVTDWQRATEKQLKMRDDIHTGIICLCNSMTDIDAIVGIAISQVCIQQNQPQLK
jgi:hypothetical protein